MILYSWAGRALQMDAQHARPSKQYGPNLFDETNQPLVKNVSNVDSAGTPLQSRGGRRTGSHTGSTGNGGTITHHMRTALLVSLKPQVLTRFVLKKQSVFPVSSNNTAGSSCLSAPAPLLSLTPDSQRMLNNVATASNFSSVSIPRISPSETALHDPGPTALLHVVVQDDVVSGARYHPYCIEWVENQWCIG
jgi:hypothetical protein